MSGPGPGGVATSGGPTGAATSDSRPGGPVGRSLATARSFLYVPGDRPERFAKALASGTDVAMLDLEDAVAVPNKDAARDNVASFLADPGELPALVLVRINQGDRGMADVAALLQAVRSTPLAAGPLAAVLVPKATPETLAAVAELAPGLPRLALVESAEGLRTVHEVARSGIVGISLGEVDLGADLAIAPTAGDHVLWPQRMAVVVASAAAGIAAPMGPVPLDFRDLDAVQASTAQLRDAGFGSRAAIHPAQVAPINEAFTPTAEAVEQASRLLALAEAAGGGVCLDDQGRMVDEAVLRTARRTLALAQNTKHQNTI